MLKTLLAPARARLRPSVNLARNQMANVRRVLAGEPLATPPFVGATLDADDAERARSWLQRRERWYDTRIVEDFEARFAAWNESDDAVAFMGGRVALSAIIDALELRPGDEVIVPGYTCIVVPNAFHFAGVDVCYADIELDTYGLDVRACEERITSRTRAIVVHHLYGLVCRDYDALYELAARHKLCVIEDCTHAAGARILRGAAEAVECGGIAGRCVRGEQPRPLLRRSRRRLLARAPGRAFLPLAQLPRAAPAIQFSGRVRRPLRSGRDAAAGSGT